MSEFGRLAGSKTWSTHFAQNCKSHGLQWVSAMICLSADLIACVSHVLPRRTMKPIAGNVIFPREIMSARRCMLSVSGTDWDLGCTRSKPLLSIRDGPFCGG